MRPCSKGEASACGQADASDSADDREQASRRERLLHRPETVGIPFPGHHQQPIRRKPQGSKTRPVRLSELEQVPLPLAPEHHVLLCRLDLMLLSAMQKGSGQGKAEIPNRVMTAITIGHQLQQSRFATTAR